MDRSCGRCPATPIRSRRRPFESTRRPFFNRGDARLNRGAAQLRGRTVSLASEAESAVQEERAGFAGYAGGKHHAGVTHWKADEVGGAGDARFADSNGAVIVFIVPGEEARKSHGAGAGN